MIITGVGLYRTKGGEMVEVTEIRGTCAAGWWDKIFSHRWRTSDGRDMDVGTDDFDITRAYKEPPKLREVYIKFSYGDEVISIRPEPFDGADLSHKHLIYQYESLLQPVPILA